MGSRNDNLPRMPIEVPNTIKIAGPMQQDAARNDASMVPMLDIFSLFIQKFPFYMGLLNEEGNPAFVVASIICSTLTFEES